MTYTCYHCFQEKQNNGACPFCGYDPAAYEGRYPAALRPGSVLNGKYIVGRVLGQGGFGITYIAKDYKTGERVAIKEYLPSEFAGRNGSSVQPYSGDHEANFVYGKEQFLTEAKTLAAFIGDEHIVRIYSFFEENNTAYFAMEYVDGLALDKVMAQQGGRLSVAEADRYLLPLMESLNRVHAKGIVHRDISPDNIIITKDGITKLIDFGAARFSTGEKSKSLDVILKHGFAPPEQYMRRGRQGPFTDVYALGATYYYAISGKVPPDSIERMQEDMIILPRAMGVKISRKQEDALLKALEVNAADRYQNMGEFYYEMAQAAGIKDTSARKEKPVANSAAPLSQTEQEALAEAELHERAAREAREKAARLEQERREQERREKEARKQAEKRKKQRQKQKAQAEKEQKRAESSAQPKKTKRPILVFAIAILFLTLAVLSAKVILPNLKKDEVVPEQTQSEEQIRIEVGDIITFGSYEQDNNLINGKEPIEWQVLEKESDRILVISKHALDCQPYNATSASVTWETCSLRNWLNDYFLRTAFSEEEQSMVSFMTVSADKNPKYNTNPGNDTTDQVFLLSITDANKYFHSDEERPCAPTAYAVAHGNNKHYNGNCWWWLRSPGGNSYIAADVSSDGSVDSSGSNVHNRNGAVRPALWITSDATETGILSSAISESLNEESESNQDTSESSGQLKIRELKEASVGDYVLFGSYEQDNDTENGKEDIEWLVLGREDDRILVISKYVLDCQPYNTTNTGVTWETCSLRKWLNDSFLRTVFTEEERSMIPFMTISADNNPNYTIVSPGTSTRDQVFLLSITEANKFFSLNEERKCAPTAYAVANGVYKASNGNCCWWLRSPGGKVDRAARVSDGGNLNFYSNHVDGRDGVRPAMWIDLSALETEGSSLDAPDVSNENRDTFEQPEMEELKKAAVGDYISYGAYEQDNDLTNGEEPIEWLVLAEEHDRILVISKYGLDAQSYNKTHMSVSWETCSLRGWLNNSFLRTAFTKEEREKIPSVTVNADKNPSYSTELGKNTKDQIFLLSITEANMYFKSDNERKCIPTSYAVSQGANSNCWWWLRSPGSRSSDAADVDHSGSVETEGYDVGSEHGTVRPALWINVG